MRGAIPPLPQYVFMEWCLVKYRDNLTFYLLWSRVVIEILINKDSDGQERDLKLTTHLNLVPRLRLFGSASPLPHMPNKSSRLGI
jgi:hypothetical protein